MTGRHKRRMHLDPDEKTAIIEALGQCRAATLKLQEHTERKTIIWREAEVLRRQIDDMAMVFSAIGSSSPEDSSSEADSEEKRNAGR